jgi:hypothetical protein
MKGVLQENAILKEKGAQLPGISFRRTRLKELGLSSKGSSCDPSYFPFEKKCL